MRFLIVFILFAGALGAEASGRAEKALDVLVHGGAIRQ